MGKTYDEEFYEHKSWGAVSIKEAKDLPTLKLQYLMTLLKARKKADATLLEVGCGSGRILTSIRDRDKRIKLTGIDLSKEQVALAKRANKGRNITFVAGDGQKLPFKDNSFDYVIFLDFLEHIEKPQQALKEMRRVLKTGGFLYAVVPAENKGIYKISKKLFGRHFKEATAGHIQQYTLQDIERMVKNAKLGIINRKYSYHFLGSVMDYALFTLLLNDRIAEVFWSKNKYYQGTKQKQSFASRVLNGLMTFGNGIAFYESKLFKNTKFSATAIHIIAKKE